MTKKDTHNIDKNYKQSVAKAKHEPAESQVVVGGAKSSTHSISKKQKILVFSGLALLIMLSAGWLFAHSSFMNTTKPSDKITKQADGVVTKKDISSLEKATSGTGSADDYANLGGAYVDSGQADKAIVAFNKSIEINPQNNVQALSGLVYVYASSGNSKDAINALNQLIDIAKKSSDVSAQADVQKYQVQIDRLQQGLDI